MEEAHLEMPLLYKKISDKYITKPSKIILHFVKTLLDKGYCIGMDNYYACLELLTS